MKNYKSPYIHHNDSIIIHFVIFSSFLSMYMDYDVLIGYLPWVICGVTILMVKFLDKSANPLIKKLLNWFPAILFAYLIPALISKFGSFDFSDHEIHNFSRNYIIPLAIITSMSSLSVLQLSKMGWKPIVVFVGGSVWIALFPVIFILLFSNSNFTSEILGEAEYWKGMPPIVGGWIGGSTSQIVLKELANCPENIFLNVLVLDNILVNIWTILMFQGIKKSDVLNSWLKITSNQKPRHIEASTEPETRKYLYLTLLVIVVLVVNLITDTLITKIIILSIAGLAFASTIKNWPFRLVLKAGGLLILMVMAILGLKLKFNLIQFEPSFLILMIVWLSGHFVFMLLIAKVLNMNLAWVPIASMANVGGIATAPAVTSAYETKWMPHAIILAVLSMATGTFWGMVTIYFLNSFF